MRRAILILVVIALLSGAGYFGYTSFFKGGSEGEIASEQNTPSALEMAAFEDKNLGFKFSYRKSPQGYVLKEIPKSLDKNPLFLKGLILILEADEKLMISPEVPSETPPTINISVFRNSKKLSPLVWAESNAVYSNINQKIGPISETVVGEAKALNFKADGLYVSNNFIVSRAGYIYLFSGSYTTETDPLYLDFMPLLDSVEFSSLLVE